MKNLLVKEFTLALHQIVFVFPPLCALLLIPNWPYFIALGYIFIAYDIIFTVGKANQDIIFTVSLPIRKRDAVRARVYMVVAIELLQLIAAIPFAIIRNMIYHNGNMGGMNANIAFFGCILVMYAIFNITFLPMFYKTAHKTVIPVILAISAVIVYVSGLELAVHWVPFLQIHLNPLGANRWISQLMVLIGGIGIFALLTAFAYQRAAQNFEKVDL